MTRLINKYDTNHNVMVLTPIVLCKKYIMKNAIKFLGAISLLLILQPQFVTGQQKSTTDNNTQQEGYKFDNGNQELNRAYVDRILTRKTNELEQYLTVLVEKKDNDYLKAIDKAMRLFNNDDSRLVTITSKSTGKVYIKPIRDYLNDVAKLPYKSVNITYRNFSAINNIRRQPDGKYTGVVVFEQEFTGYDKEGKAMYHDVIRRNVEVTIKIAEYTKKGENAHRTSVDIFFNNVGVTEIY